MEAHYRARFRISRTDLPKAVALATRLGVELEETDIDREDLAERLDFQMFRNRQAPFSPESYARADALLRQWVEVVVLAPRNEWSVVATAEQATGPVMFFTVDRGAPYWTPELMDGIDFKRCDECGRHTLRNKLFIVRKGDAVRQIGGQCAVNLNLAKKMMNLLDTFCSFERLLSEEGVSVMGHDVDDGFGGGGRDINRERIPFVLLLAEECISVAGYVSRATAEARMVSSTADWLKCMLWDRTREKLSRDNDQWRNAARRDSKREGDAIVAEVLAWLDTQPDGEFVRNMRAAVEYGASKHLGLAVYAMSATRDWRAQKKCEMPAFVYEHAETSPEDVAAMCGVSLEALGELLGHGGAKLKAPARKAIAKMLPGRWTLLVHTTVESEYGTSHLLQFQRQDGARVKWFASSRPDVMLKKGSEYLILSASVGEALPVHPKYGVQGRKISRAKVVEAPTA